MKPKIKSYQYTNTCTV